VITVSLETRKIVQELPPLKSSEAFGVERGA
jgi:hypothetical protein